MTRRVETLHLSPMKIEGQDRAWFLQLEVTKGHSSDGAQQAVEDVPLSTGVKSGQTLVFEGYLDGE